VNRLDRDTSGLILIAKDNASFENLQKQFLEHTVVKEYLALCWGTLYPRGSRAKIVEPISRHKKDPRIWVCGTGVGERETKRDAETDYEVEESNEKFSTLRLFPRTGRTHQLRLHCRFIGHPIVGDEKYGVNGITNIHSTEQIKNLVLTDEDLEYDKNSRLMLHAKSLEFTHPHTNKKIKLETIFGGF
jgi:RluA family pseudouridine synthase